MKAAMPGPLRRLYRTLQEYADYCDMLRYALAHLAVLRRPPVLTVFSRQVYFTGMQPLRLVVLLGLIGGTLVVTQTTALVGNNNALGIRMLVWTIVEEMGPLVAAMIIIARSTTAITAELGIMNLHGELEQLRLMGIPPEDYLMIPRLCGVTLSVVVLTLYFLVAAVVAGLLASAMFQNIALEELYYRFIDTIDPGVILFVSLKSLLFGVSIVVIACHNGLTMPRSVTAIPVAGIQAVMRSLLVVFSLDALLAAVRFLL